IAAWGLASEVLNSPVQSDFSEVVQDSLPRALADNDPNRITFDVFFDTERPPATLAISDIETQQYDPDWLDICKTYYWQVVAKNTIGETATGNIWSFTAESVPADFDEDCDVDFSDLAVFASYWLFSPD
ncbi:MAG: hypothetical protein ACYTFW_03300, partial [Planctomycetota bacterium]